jgi:UDP-N-acetyl-D-glucosamine dehydrogenase
MERLRDAGAILDYSDPHVPNFPSMREHHFDLASVDLTPENLSSYDAVILLTDHELFDYDMIAAHAQLIIDSRGKYRKPMPHLVKA